jgi:RNA polymerase sigma-70 factor (ECF subfamily)
LANISDDAELRALMVAYQSGQFDAFDELYARVAPVVRRYLLAHARDAAKADDLLQETFLQMHRARATFNPAFPLMPWIMAIARHVWLMDRRLASRRPRATEDVTVLEVPVRAEAASFADRAELQHALAQVGSPQRDAIVRHHLWGWSFKEVADRAGIAEAAAKLRSSRGMAKLRAALKPAFARGALGQKERSTRALARQARGRDE